MNNDSSGDGLVTAVYGGTFDPITNGHMDIIARSAKIFDRVIVAVAWNVRHKSAAMFSAQQRLGFVQKALAELPLLQADRVVALPLRCLLVDFARQHNAKILVRGLRAVGDFEYEFQMAAVNHQLGAEIETIFMPANDRVHYLASRMVRDVLLHQGDCSAFVPKSVYNSIMGSVSRQTSAVAEPSAVADADETVSRQ